jgi:hypothetical protein
VANQLIYCRYCGRRIEPTTFEGFGLFKRATGDQDTFCTYAPVAFHVPHGFTMNRSLVFRPGTAKPKSKRQAEEWAATAAVIAGMVRPA